MSGWIKGARKGPNRLPGRKKLRPVDIRDMNKSTIVPAPDSVVGNENFDISLNFASTPAAKKRCVPSETPKSILKCKRQSEVKSDNKGKDSSTKTGKKCRIALPKRKSLLS